jgi:hypothetical protein
MASLLFGKLSEPRVRGVVGVAGGRFFQSSISASRIDWFIWGESFNSKVLSSKKVSL